MVRLVDIAALNIMNAAGFQFHYGTIGRIIGIIVVVAALLFQFHLLRLVVTGVAKYGNNFAFQFHYGTIGSPRYHEETNHFLTCFNSTMVRLVVQDGIVGSLQMNLFQFHYGTIGRQR